ncbi:MAG: TonB family protein [Acidobacteriaceae bacterium]|nr:TonB family protein [Acidobacteriaceae bacterium]
MGWFWTSLLIRSAVILAAAEILRRLPRKSDPAYRHRVVLAAFGLLLLWPLFSAIVPEIRLSLWPHLPTRGSVTVQQTIFLPERDLPAARRINWPLAIWATGAFLALAPVLIGHLRVLRMARRAAPLADQCWKDALDEGCSQLGIRKKPDLLISVQPVMPLTFGMRRPRILLPAECLEWTPLRRRTVLLHEMAHVQRRDLSAQLFASLITALWWFQPLCWTSRRSLRRESERACDAVVIASGIRASDYASELLHIAQSFSRGKQWPAAAITMARRGELEGRLYAILGPLPDGRIRGLSIAAVSALTLLTLSASAITVLPKEKDLPGGGLSMKRTLLSGLLASAGLSAATIGGSVFDPSGAAVPNAKALVYDPDTSIKQETTTGPEGKFAFDNLPAGQYILRIEKPGFTSLFREFNVQADSKVEKGLVLNLGSIQEEVNVQGKGARAAVPQPLNPQQLRIGGAVQESKLTKKVQPVYPASAKAAGVEGTVRLEMVIGMNGVPLDIRVVSSPSDDLTQSALDAVRQWEYSTTLLNGQPVEVVTDVTVNYTLAH